MGSHKWVAEIIDALKKPDADRSINKRFVATANSSALKMQSKEERDEEVVMSSWAKEERLMKLLECFEVEKDKIWAHYQEPWSQMQSLRMSAYLHLFKNSASSGKNL